MFPACSSRSRWVAPFLLSVFASSAVLEAGSLHIDLPLRPGGRGIERKSDLFRPVAKLAEIQAGEGGLLSLASAEFIQYHPDMGLLPAKPDGALTQDRESGPLQAGVWGFCVSASGKFELWVRVRVVDEASRVVFWNLLRPEMNAWSQSALTIKGGAKSGWQWLKLGSTLSLDRREEYRLALRAPSDDVEIEALAIVPEGKAVGEGSETAFAPVGARLASVSQVESLPIALPVGTKITGVAIEPALEGENPGYFYSLDGGTSWVPYHPRESIEGYTGGSIAFRARVQKGEAGAGFHKLRLSASPESWPVLANDEVELHFDPATGGLLRLRDRRNDRDLLWSTMSVIPAALDLKAPGSAEWQRVTPTGVQKVRQVSDEREEATAEHHAEALSAQQRDQVAEAGKSSWVLKQFKIDGQRAIADYLVAGAVQLRLIYSVEEAGGVKLRAEVLNESPVLDVIRLEFPSLPRLRLGENGWDDDQLRMQNFGHLRRAPGVESLREVKYPGALAMPWESLSDAQGHLGIISIDPLFRNTAFSSKPSGVMSESYDFTLRTLDTIPAKGGKAEREVLLTVGPGQWHAVADRYKQWSAGALTQPHYPNWLAASDGFLNVQLQLGCKSFAELPRFARSARRLNLDYIQFWGQMAGPRGGCCAPYVEPVPILGGRAALSAALREYDEKGIRAGFYMLPDRFDRNHALPLAMNGVAYRSEYGEGTLFPELEWMDRVRWIGSPDGELPALALSSSEEASFREAFEAFRKDPTAHSAPRDWKAVDLTDPEWHQWIARWAVDEYADKMGAHALYLDVMGTGAVRESFDRRKGDHGKGRYGAGRAATVAAIQKRAEAAGKPELGILVEGAMDLSGQYAAPMVSGLYRNRVRHLEPNATEMLRYTFPERVVFEGHSNQGNFAKSRRLEAAHLNGNRFDMVYPYALPAGLIAARQAVKPWLYTADYKHTLGLEAPVPARLFVRESDQAKGVVITLLNSSAAEGVLRFPASLLPDGSRLISIDAFGRFTAHPFRKVDHQIETAIPLSPFSILLGVSESSAEDAVIASVVREIEGDQLRAKLHLANVGTTAREVSLATSAGDPSGSHSIAPGQVVTIPVPHAPGVYGDPEVTAELRWEGGSRKIRHTLLPLSDWELLDTVTQGEESQFVMPPSQGTAIRQVPLHLPPGDYELSLEYHQTPGNSKNSSALLITEQADTTQHTTPLKFGTVGEWTTATALLKVPRDAFSTSLYFYNTESERTLSLRRLSIKSLPAVSTP